MSRSLTRPLSGLCAVLVCTLLSQKAGGDRGAESARIVVSVEGATLRLERGKGKGRRIFPIAVGRLDSGKETTPLGTLYTGPDPKDINLYIARRERPAFHRGLPTVRLDLRRPSKPGIKHYPFALHGPVTPTLIWGRASRGCIRMSEAGIKAVYRFASRHPSLPVTVIQGVDRVRGKRVAPDAVGRRRKGCPESAIGARRLGRLKVGQVLHERVCGGVDHWYALELQGGDRVSLKLDHRGGLKLELYGIKGISTVATGTHGLNFLVPLARNNRGHRYVRVVAPRDPKLALPYTLKVTMGGNAIESPP